jgi:hypothetical protein
MDQKHIAKIKKIIDLIQNLEIVDSKLTKKYILVKKEINFYDSLLIESKNNFTIIIKNLT